MKVLIIGGTGTLGHELVDRWNDSHEITVLSRDECKQWKMKLRYPKVRYVVCDTINRDLVALTMSRIRPDAVIIASAMKHLDICEYNMEACLNNNMLGIKNVLDCVAEPTKCVVFVSTDKACSPVNSYGMCKALCERMTMEKSIHNPDIKFVSVRYGNVLNSRGSILQILHNIGQDVNKSHFTLTENEMTRFIMTIQEAGDLIEYAMEHGKTGEVVMPRLRAMRIKDLVEIFSDIYGKPYRVTGIRVGEKMAESLFNETQSRMVYERNGYIHMRNPYLQQELNQEACDYNSDNTTVLNKDDLKAYLESVKLL